MSNKQDKFNFVDFDETKDIESIKNIEVVKSPTEVKVDSLEKEENKKDNKRFKFHYSFEARVATTIFIILVLFISSCVLIYKVVNHTKPSKVYYNEITSSNYEVCLKSYNCEQEDITYNANDINIIKVKFNYSNKYAKKIKYNLNYNIVANIKVYENDSRQNVLYEKERELVEKEDVSNTGDFIDITRKVSIDYQKYREEVKDYYLNVAECEVSFYVNEPNETRKVTSVIIPLNKDSFEIERKNTTNIDRYVNVDTNLWDKYSIICTIIASILIIITLIIVYKATRIVLRVTNNKTIYQQEVDDILKEYDDIIVVARDGYESNINRKIVKLENFEDLLEIQRKKNKPIIYSRINDIKSEFLIEDDKLYKVVYKESDYE